MPHLGDSVSFTVSYPNSLDGSAVSIHLHCYQEGSMVFGTSGPAAASFLLGGTVSPWRDYLGGAATCRADLYYWSKNGTRMNVLASTEFDAQGW